MIETPPKTGEILAKDLATKDVEFNALAEQFLYANTSMMIASDPGSGKSTLCIQIASSLASGRDLFDRLKVSRPMRVYYLSFETVYEEFLRQLRAMGPTIPTTPDFLCWDDELIGLNVLRDDHITVLLKRLETWKPIDLLIVDPVYMMLSAGITTDEGGSAISRCLTMVKRHAGCGVLFTNQTKRPRHAQATGELIVEDHPFYGSRRIEAHVHAAYYLTKQPRHQGIVLTNKKDRLKACRDRLTLVYRPETMTCTMEEEAPSEAMRRLLDFVKTLKGDGRTSDFYEAVDVVGCSQSHLYRLIKEPEVLEQIDFEIQKGKRTIWKPR